MTANRVFNTVARDLRLINFAEKTVRTVRFISTAVGIAVAAVTVIDAVKLLKR